MTRQSPRSILAGHQTDNLVGRDGQLARLRETLELRSSIGVLGQPGAGTSALLRETYDRLFNDVGDAVPIFFQVSEGDQSLNDLAGRFARDVLTQFLAFYRKSPDLVITGATAAEIDETRAELAWVPFKSGAFETAGWDVLTCFSLPLRAAAAGHRLLLMVDNIHLPIAGPLLADLKTRYRSAGISLAVAGHRRQISPAIVELPGIHVDALPVEDGAELVRQWSAKLLVAVTDECADLAALQLGGRPALIGPLIHTALQLGLDLDTFHNVEKAYTQAIFGGPIARRFDHLVAGTSSQRHGLASDLTLLTDIYSGRKVDARIPHLSSLHEAEIVNVHSGRVWPSEDLALADYVAGNIFQNGVKSRAAAFGKALTTYVARAPDLMARHYRRKSALPLKEIVGSFAGQKIPLTEVDYEEARAAAASDSIEEFTLPFIAFTADAQSMYPDIAQLIDTERCVIGMGFSDRTVRDPVGWLAAEIESKLEAKSSLAEFWCDRLEMAALHCGFSNYRIWLIAPEGFDSGAIEILSARNAIGSSRSQVQQLMERLTMAQAPPPSPDCYQMTLPGGNNSELIGARALEEIAHRLGFPSKAINQMKTALVEACINATEHSLSPDRKVHIRFVEEADRLVITVQNRGLRLPDRALGTAISSISKRRGWGLKLIQGLMDEVSSEYTEDGTILRMAKAIPQS